MYRFDTIFYDILGVDDNIYSTPEEAENHEYQTVIPEDNLQIQGKYLFAFCSVGQTTSLTPLTLSLLKNF